MITTRTFFCAAALMMLVDGIGYSLGALIPIQKGLQPTDVYWQRRLRLNLLLANQGLYFAGITALLGAYFVNTQPAASRAIEILCFLTCLYTMITVPLFTPRDWPHIFPRVLAACFILIGWVML